MQIGVFTSAAKPNWGGSYSLQVSLVNSLIKQAKNSKHSFIIVNQLRLKVDKNNLPINVKIYTPNSKSAIFILRIFLHLFIEFYNFIKYPGTTFSIKKVYSKSLLPLGLYKKIDLNWSISPLYLDNGKPFVLTIWDLLYLDFPGLPEISKGGAWDQLHNHYCRLVLKASRIFVTSSVTKNKLVSVFGCDYKKIDIIPLPFIESAHSTNLQDIGNQLDNSKKSEFLLYPAQLWPHKNHRVILDAIATLKNELKLTFVFTGSDKGNLKYLKREIKKLGIDNYISFKGFVDAKEFNLLFSQAKAIVFPSIAEPDNLPAIDSIMSNKLVICADIPGIREQLSDKAFFIDPFDVEGWANAIKSLQDNTLMPPKMNQKNEFLTDQDYVKLALVEINQLEKYIRLWS